MSVTRHVSRASFAFLVLLPLLLAGCFQDVQPGTPASPTDPPGDAPAALVYGMANSPVYEALKSRVKMTMSDGSQKANDFDLVILDGDGFSGEQLSSDSLVREAIRSGVWVLGLDTAEEDKDGIGELLHASSQGDAAIYLVRQVPDETGRLGSRLVEFVNPEQEVESRVQAIETYLREKVAPQQTVPGDIPTRALTYYIDHTSVYSGSLPNSMQPVFIGKTGQGLGLVQGNNPQTITWTVDHQIRLFLDASNNAPFGKFQHVLVDLIGNADPGQLAVDNKDNATDNANMSEVAWIQTRFDASTAMPQESGLVLQKSLPENADNTETVTSGGYQIMVGFDGASPQASFNYTSPQTTTTISEWQSINTSNANAAAQWSYASNTVYNGMNTDSFDPGAWFYYFEGVVPQTPNGLSLDAFSYGTESYWTNNQVYGGTINVTGTDSVWYTDAWVVQQQFDDNPDGNSHYCLYGCDFDEQPTRYGPDPEQLVQHMARHNLSNPWSLQVDMSAIIPVKTASLTFTQLSGGSCAADGAPVASVVEGGTVCGVLTLEKPTPVPAEILITSTLSGVTPENSSYLMPANTNTLTFKVSAGAEGNEGESATISALYADGQNAPLTVCPASSPNCLESGSDDL